MDFAREYELVYIARPDLADEDLEVIATRTQNIITERDGKVLKLDEWGKKKLAYEIRKYNKGHYMLVDYLGGAEIVKETERTLGIDDGVLRFLTIKVGDRVDVEERVAAVAAELEAAAAAADGAAPQV